MKTIEERAEYYAKKRDEFGDVDIPDVEVMSDIECEDYLRETYIEIATEQEAITKQEMIDKACEWLTEHAKAFGSAEATDVWEATYKYDSKLLVEQFKKAMEK